MQKVKEINVADVINAELENVVAQYVPVPTIRTLYNSKYFPKHHEINTEPSMTVPDDAMTIQEIVHRYAHGMPLSGRKDGQYHGEDSELPNDMENLDLAEREEILREVARKRDEIIEQVNDRKKKADEKRLEAQVNARVKAKEEEKNKYEELKKKFEGGEL